MRFLVVLVVATAIVLAPSPAVALSAPASVVCSESVDPTSCDSDRDRITDVLEKQICGTSTCATGREDADGDGIPDWSEVIVCGDPRCANTSKDTDGDGIPDFAEVFVCGSESCSTGREDADGDAIADWVEFVICSDSFCANGTEDYDADGVSDARQLASCVVAFDVTGPGVWAYPSVAGLWAPTKYQLQVQVIWWPVVVGGVLFVVGMTALGVALARQRRRDAERIDDGTAEVDDLLGISR